MLRPNTGVSERYGTFIEYGHVACVGSYHFQTLEEAACLTFDLVL